MGRTRLGGQRRPELRCLPRARPADRARASSGWWPIAAVFIDILQIVARCGLPDAVVQRADLDEDFAATAFWVMLGSGALYAAALVAVAGPIAAMFDLPELRPVLCALSACFVITAAGAIHEARLQRSFGFRKLALRALGSNILGGAAALALAVSGYGVWSLVVQRLVAATATTLLTWAASRWVPARRLDLAAARAPDRLRLPGVLHLPAARRGDPQPGGDRRLLPVGRRRRIPPPRVALHRPRQPSGGHPPHDGRPDHLCPPAGSARRPRRDLPRLHRGLGLPGGAGLLRHGGRCADAGPVPVRRPVARRGAGPADPGAPGTGIRRDLDAVDDLHGARADRNGPPARGGAVRPRRGGGRRDRAPGARSPGRRARGAGLPVHALHRGQGRAPCAGGQPVRLPRAHAGDGLRRS